MSGLNEVKKEPEILNPERWAYLMSLKQPDAIGNAFAMLEASILHHILERDGWHPSDECYMETLAQARKLIEDDRCATSTGE